VAARTSTVVAGERAGSRVSTRSSGAGEHGGGRRARAAPSANTRGSSGERRARDRVEPAGERSGAEERTRRQRTRAAAPVGCTQAHDMAKHRRRALGVLYLIQN